MINIIILVIVIVAFLVYLYMLGAEPIPEIRIPPPLSSVIGAQAGDPEIPTYTPPFAALYTKTGFQGGAPAIANSNDVYVFCSQRDGVKTWNYQSIQAPVGTILCLFSINPGNGNSTSDKRFIITRNPIRDIRSMLTFYPEITNNNTGIMFNGWEHIDLDFVIMPVTLADYAALRAARADECKKLTDYWGYTDEKSTSYCNYIDPMI